MSVAGHSDFLSRYFSHNRNDAGGPSSLLPSPSQIAHQLLTSPLRSSELSEDGDEPSSTCSSPKPGFSESSGTLTTDSTKSSRSDSTGTPQLLPMLSDSWSRPSRRTRRASADSKWSGPDSSTTSPTSASTPGISHSTTALAEMAASVRWGQMNVSVVLL